MKNEKYELLKGWLCEEYEEQKNFYKSGCFGLEIIGAPFFKGVEFMISHVFKKFLDEDFQEYYSKWTKE